MAEISAGITALEQEEKSTPRPRPFPAPKPGGTAGLVLGGIQTLFQLGGRVAPGPVAGYAYKMYFTPRRKKSSPKEDKLTERARAFSVPFTGNQYVPYPGGDLSAWMWGESGPVVLLVHGWETNGAWMAAPFLNPLLAAGFRVVTFDMPGHGTSPGKYADLMDFASAIQAVAGSVGEIHAIIAHSLGAAATTVAIANGLQVERLVYLAPVCWILALPEQFCEVFKLAPAAERDFYRRMISTYSESTWVKTSGDVASRHIKVPGLIVHDKGDTRVHYEDAQAIHAQWPQSELMTTEGLDHREVTRNRNVIKRTIQFVSNK